MDQSNYLTIAQLKEIAQSGLVEIGAHTIHHIASRGGSKEQVTKEIAQSRVQ